MNCNFKLNQKLNEKAELTRANLKLFLLALRQSEGFGAERLTRVLYEFCEISKGMYDPDDMFIVDEILQKELGNDILGKIGKERF